MNTTRHGLEISRLEQTEHSHDILDALIVGGGIHGAGIARDLSGRGLRVALIEQFDLAAATSSKSTKLIHGGLRYLEHYEFRLVREALSERETLLRIAPHIVQPREFILTHVPGLRPRWMISLGLWLYDHLGDRDQLPASRSLRLNGSPYGTALRPELTHGFSYADCWVDDSRLVILNALDAAERGARIHTRTRLLAATPHQNVWRAKCEDLASGTHFELRARTIVNAAGPWVEDTLLRCAVTAQRARTRLVKGSHIVVPRMYVGDHAYMLQNPDGRIVFAIPFEGDYTLIGTTDVPYTDDPANVTISAEEIDYLCRTIAQHFHQPPQPSDVRWTFAGVRQLFDDHAQNASKVTRDYTLELTHDAERPPLLSIFGGKLTTYRKLAETVAARLRPHIGGSETSWTGREPLPGGALGTDLASFTQQVHQRWPFLNEALASRLARSYGSRIEHVLGEANAMEDLGLSFGAGLTQAEVEYLRTKEWAWNAEDILWRRTKLGLHMTPQQRSDLERYLAANPR